MVEPLSPDGDSAKSSQGERGEQLRECLLQYLAGDTRGRPKAGAKQLVVDESDVLGCRDKTLSAHLEVLRAATRSRGGS